MRNRNGFRRCNKCLIEFEATTEFFPRDANRPLGIGYQCKECANAFRRAKGDSRKNRWSKLMTPEQRQAKYKISRAYYHGKGRAAVLIAAYRSVDKKRGFVCDLDATWFKEFIENKPCYYCGETTDKRGCDRLDNNLGHTKDNVVACCALCNHTRTNRFTHEEMKLLGHTIHRIRLARTTG